MIGPHEGKELQLMLSGKKPLAVFHDAIPATEKIPEEIIPETAFAPHVQTGKIKRLAADLRSAKDDHIIRYVCYTLPGEEWRAHFLLWLKTEQLSGRLQFDPAHDIIIGHLLGYGESDIDEFLERQEVRLKSKHHI